MLRLVVINGPGIGAQLKVTTQAVLQIGRSRTADLTLDDPQVADLHLKLYREGNGLACFDVTGRGFGHNDRRVLKAQLQVGDVITLGQHAIRLIADQPELMPRVASGLEIPAGAGRAVLRAVEGNDAGKVFPLGEKSVVILGRGVSTDITLWDIRASRAHARIDRQGDAYRLSDLNSSNGTYVNEQRVTSHFLRPGDRIRIGSTVLQFAPAG